MIPLRRTCHVLQAGCVWAALVILLPGCQGQRDTKAPTDQRAATRPATRPAVGAAETPASRPPARAYKLAHVFVALCDNRHQGIVKVPRTLGNGQDPPGNLYWGAMYGVKTFFRRSPHWEAVEIARRRRPTYILDRAVFRRAGGGRAAYVVAEAFDGAKMRAALTEFFDAAAGRLQRSVEVRTPAGPLKLAAGGQADMVCFVGHNGLMDVRLDEYPQAAGGRNPAAAVVLACRSRSYFAAPLARAGCEPMITTSGLMAPEAYTLDAIIRSWAAGDLPSAIRSKAAAAYAKYQKCPLRAAKRLFVTGR